MGKHLPLLGAVTFLPFLWISGAGADQNDAKQAYTFDASTLKPFTDGVPYLEKFETGLYPGAKNEMPEVHRKAGERIAATLRPLDLQGQPDEKNGRILALVLGHSSGKQYFAALGQRLQERSAEVHPRFEMLNAAVPSEVLSRIVALKGSVWSEARKLTERAGYSPKQVQVLFLQTTCHQAYNSSQSPPGPFPDTMKRMQADLVTVLRHCTGLYPNLRIAYLTTDVFRGFTGLEPHVWQESFAVKWLIEDQIKGTPETACEGEGRKLPWLAWGPYLWDNTWGRDHFDADGAHPGRKALEIFADKYLKYLTTDGVAKAWILKSGAR